MTADGAVAAPRRQAEAIRRMLEPKGLAVVGASEKNPFLGSLLDNATAAGLDLVLVNPRQTEVFGRPTVPTLLDSDCAIDTVMSLVGAEHTLSVVEDAVRVGAGGVIVTAARFGEAGAEGAQLEQAIREIAADAGLAVCGPNCLGAFNVAKSIHLYIGTERHVRKGHVALVSQSGGLFTTLQLAAAEKGIGFSHMISTGNEAATDLVDFLEFLIEDEATAAVGLVVEQIRRPKAFLEVTARAREAGKFFAALKIGRSPGGQRASASHTGALMADAREYDIAFRQAGVEIAMDMDDLLGVLQLFSHYSPRRWAAGNKVAVLTASGGVAALAADAFDDAGLPLPQDEAINAQAVDLIPGTLSANPLDITGVNYNDESFTELLDLFLASPSYDTVITVNYLQEGMEAFSRPLLDPLRRAVTATDKRLIAVSAAETAVAPWAEGLLDEGIALGVGIGATVRSLAAMDRFAERRARPQPEPIAAIAQPTEASVVESGGIDYLTFSAGMELLESFGVPIAPHAIWDGAHTDLPAGGRFVVKLADVPHRTELGAVIVGVDRDAVPDACAQLQALAQELDVPNAVAVQPMLEIEHELFIGVEGASTFGPLLIVGIGGIAVEALGDVSMRVAPLTTLDAHEMLAELRGARLLDEFRGRAGLDRGELARILVSVGRLAAAAATWLETLDINPLIGNGDGLAAVDVSAVVTRPLNQKESST